MAIKINSAAFQGYPVLALQMAFSGGTRPDFGFVDLNIRDFKKLEIQEPGIIPYRPDEIPGQLSVDGFDGLFGRRTITDELPALDTPKQGLFPVGDLVLETQQGRLKTKITWKNLFIAPGGMQEVTEDLALAHKHEAGTWRITIADARLWWHLGALASSINMRLDGGQFNPDTIEGPNPWETNFVFSYMFSQMAGSPIIHPESQFFGLKRDTPENIIGDLLPAVQPIDKLLDRYGFRVDPTPGGHWALSKRWQKVERGEFFIAPNTISRVGLSLPAHVSEKDFPDPAELIHVSNRGPAGPPFKGQSYERESITVTGKPPMVQVKGQRRIKSIDVAYAPIFQDTDEKFYLLLGDGGLSDRWGYSQEDIDEQALVDGERQAMNIPGGPLDKKFTTGIQPRSAPRGDGERYALRRELFQRCVYKMYGPAHAFVKTLPDGTVQQIGLTRQELVDLPYTPIQDFADLRDKANTPKGFEIVAPQVRGYRIRQGFYTGKERFKVGGTGGQRLAGERVTPSGGIVQAQGGAGVPGPSVKPPKKERAWDEIRRAIDDHVKQMKSDVKKKEQAYDETIKEQAKAIEDLLAIDLWFDRNKGDIAKEIGEEDAELLIEFNNDGSNEATSFLGARRVVFRAKDEVKFNRARKNLEQLTQQLAKDAEEIERAKEREEIKRDQIENVFLNIQGLHGWINQNHKRIPEATYNIERETGIITFEDVVGLMEEPFVITREQTRIQTHGHIIVRHGYEIRTNDATEWSSALFIDGGSGKPQVVGMCRASPIKALMVNDPNLRIYEDDLGNAINGIPFLLAAAKKAGAVTQPRSVKGFIYEMSGFHLAVPISGQVQYTFNGDVAMTFIAVNAPNARLKLGSELIKTPTKTDEITIREFIE